MLQIHVKGIDGKTYTVNLISDSTTVSEVKIKINDKTGIKPNEQRLIYGGKQMQDDRTLHDYSPLSHGSTIFLVLRLPGGSSEVRFQYADSTLCRSNDTRTITFEQDSYLDNPAFARPCSFRRIDPKLRHSNDPCMITFEEDSPDNPVFVMPCGHSMSPDGLMDYCWNEIGSRKCEIRCPLCNQEWTINVICKYGCAVQHEIHQLEVGLSRNFCQHSTDILECPSCNSFCERRDHIQQCVQCVVCTKKRGGVPFCFCWQCLNQWRGPPGEEQCGNAKCSASTLLAQLTNAVKVKPLGLKIEVLSTRACPVCGSLIELDGGCKHMTCCTRCRQDFCFVCLRTKSSGSWSCGGYNVLCTPAPVQTRIPVRSR